MTYRPRRLPIDEGGMGRSRVTRRRRVAAGVALTPALLLAACSGPSAAQHPPTTSKVPLLAQRYRVIVSDGNQQLNNLSTELNKANGNVPVIQSGFRSVSNVYREVAATVQSLPFPTSMHGDVSTMVAALGRLSNDSAQGAQAVSSPQFNSVFTKLATDEKAEIAANDTVNHDLGISSIN